METLFDTIFLARLSLFAGLPIATMMGRIYEKSIRYFFEPRKVPFIEPPSSPLFTLPAELRNEVYRLVIMKNERIGVPEETSMEAALLCVCKQITVEATYIFCCENEFHFELHDWDYSGLQAFVDRALLLHNIESPICRTKNTSVSSGAVFNREKFLKFLRYYHEGPNSITFKYHTEEDPYMSALTGAFGILSHMAKAPWGQVEAVLEICLRGTSLTGDGWEW
jgi:hypothetical protein